MFGQHEPRVAEDNAEKRVLKWNGLDCGGEGGRLSSLPLSSLNIKRLSRIDVNRGLWTDINGHQTQLNVL
ncbi:hypothetical protein BLOT_013875 [Blomia tropicalis]|nr:hypothetical protein BLOT_013875 [Blomia tropicalis]